MEFLSSRDPTSQFMLIYACAYMLTSTCVYVNMARVYCFCHQKLLSLRRSMPGALSVDICV